MDCENCEGSGRSPTDHNRPCFECDGSGSKCNKCGEACEAGASLCDDCQAEEVEE